MTMFGNVTNNSKGLAMTLANNAVPPLIALLQRACNPLIATKSTKKNSKLLEAILRESLKVIRNLSHDSGGNAACIKCGAVKEIGTSVASALKGRHWPEAERSAAAALMALATSERGKKEICTYSVNLLANLASRTSLQAGFATRGSTQSNAASAIRSASEFPPAREACVRALIPNTNLLVLVFGTNIPTEARTQALRVLCECLVDPDIKIRRGAVRGINAMVQREQAIISEAMACLYIVRNLAMVLVDMADEDEGLIAAQALDIICSNSEAAVKDLNRLQRNGVLGSNGFASLMQFTAIARFVEE